ncbi:flippase [candidate division KSB1 bacterium]|nr:flippase [candidate division KSB1 bacterium]
MSDTFISSNKLAKNTIINIIGMLLPLVVGVVSIPYIIKGLGNELFGILSIAWVILASLTLLDFGIARATTKYVSEDVRTGNGDLVPPITWTAIIISLLLGITGGIIFYYLIPIIITSYLRITPDNIYETRLSFIAIAYAIPFLLLTNSLKGVLGAAQRFDLINYVTIPVNSFSFVFPIFSLWFGVSLSTIMVYIVVTRIVATIIYFILCLNIYPACKHIQLPRLDIVKKLSSYGIWVTVTGVINPVLVYVDRFFIGSILSMELLTFYAAPLEAVQRLRILPSALMITLFPEFSTGITASDEKIKYMLFSKSFKTILIFSGVICLSLFAFSNEIILLWLGESFVEKSAIILKIVSISIMFNFLALVPFTFLQGIGRPDLPAKFHILESIFYFFILNLFIKKFGLVGAAYAWSLRVVIDFFLLFIWSQKFLPRLMESLQKEKLVHILVSLTIFGALLLSAKTVVQTLLLQILIASIVIGIMSWFYWNYIFDITERSLTKKIFSRLSLKKI